MGVLLLFLRGFIFRLLKSTIFCHLGSATLSSPHCNELYNAQVHHALLALLDALVKVKEVQCCKIDVREALGRVKAMLAGNHGLIERR